MKKLLILLVLVGIGAVVYLKVANKESGPEQPSVHIGASVEEVEKVLGPPRSILPQFGDQLRTYKAQSGKIYTIIYNGEGKVIEIHD